MNFQTQNLSRRRMFGLLGGTTAAVATGSLLLNPSGAAAAGGPLVATVYLQIVDVPTEDQTVIGELAPGDEVTNFDPMNPEVVGNLRHITTAEGLSGWVVDAGLEPKDAPPQDPVFNAIRFVTREEPLLLDPYGDVIATLVFGTQVEASDIREGEFVYGKVWLESGETHGWVRNWLLTPEGVQAFTVVLPGLSGSAPLLAEPGNEDTWIADVPNGAKALDYDGEVVDDYYGVETEFGTGWISREYLGVG